MESISSSKLRDTASLSSVGESATFLACLSLDWASCASSRAAAGLDLAEYLGGVASGYLW
jgi:hypothetical protein